VRTAILTVGIQRIEDILLTCCLQRFSEGADGETDLDAFWMHSLGCAAVCREFAERVGYREPEKAYLAGLLHDLGILVNSLAYESEYKKVLQEARERGAAVAEIEFKELGFTHCESGAVLGASWQLPQAIQDVIQYHHEVERAPAGNPLVALVHLADSLCRMRGLGYGYDEWHSVDIMADPAWAELARCCPRLEKMDLARFTMDLDAFLPMVQTLVETVFASPAKQSLSKVHR
jgi:HD-like signal output (HDOD) protein